MLAIPAGSWAEWVTGMLTAVTVGVAAWGLRHDRNARSAAEERAGRQVARLLQVETSDSESGASWSWYYRVENAATAPFFDVRFKAVTAAGRTEEGHWLVLRPGEHEVVGWFSEDASPDEQPEARDRYEPYTPTAVRPPEPDAVLTFTDEHGVRWAWYARTNRIDRL